MSEKKHIDPTPHEVLVSEISGAAWNTHRAKDDDKDLVGLAENICQNGMIHRIAVRTMPDGGYEIVDGHRRFEAAKMLGWETVPCEVYEGMSDDEAQEKTLSANLQRIANDPLLEAGCIEKLADAGKTYDQIAAQLGTDAKYVARRARLLALTEKWRAWFADKAADAVDTMELVAKHEPELQDEVYGHLGIDDDDGEVDHDDIERAFDRRKREIGKDTAFDTSACANCPYNTATHGLLFGSDEPGRCQKERCFVEKWNAATDAKIEALRKKKVDVKEASQKWNVPNYWDAKAGKTKKCTEPWVYPEDGLKRLVWTEPKAEPEYAAPAMTEEEKAEAKRVKKAHGAWMKNRRSAYDKIREVANDEERGRRVVEKAATQDAFAEVMTDMLKKRIESYAADDVCHLVYRIFGAEGLAEFGCELEPDEVNALLTKDPAEADNGEEA